MNVADSGAGVVADSGAGVVADSGAGVVADSGASVVADSGASVVADSGADIIVVGLGAMGAATLLALARRGVRALGIDRFAPPHTMGSSHGDTRITRLAVGEGTEYAPLVARSHALWRELEHETGEQLLLQCGGLVMGRRGIATGHHGKPAFVERTLAVARDNAIPHEALDADELRRRWPQMRLEGDEIASYEPSAGLVFPERCISAQLTVAARLGARTQLGTTVRAVTRDGDGVRVSTDQGDFRAARVVLTPGAWIADLAPSLAPLTRIRRQVLHWYPVADPAAYAPGRFPIFIWMHGGAEGDYFYGFPCLPGEATLKVATEQAEHNTSADTANRSVDPAESAAFHARHVAPRLAGVGNPARRAAACLYTVTPDSGFIVDTLPGIVLASACSGHGFKHSAGLGEALAAKACGAGPALESFGSRRFEGKEVVLF
jgi:sarcosine oxidase